jgi:hypothetical protein
LRQGGCLRWLFAVSRTFCAVGGFIIGPAKADRAEALLHHAPGLDALGSAARRGGFCCCQAGGGCGLRSEVRRSRAMKFCCYGGWSATARDGRAVAGARRTLAGVGGFPHAASLSQAFASGAARRASRMSSRSPRAGERAGSGRGVSLWKGDVSPLGVWRGTAAGDMSPLMVWRANAAGDTSPWTGDASPAAVSLSPWRGDTSPRVVWLSLLKGDTSPLAVSLSLLKRDTSSAAARGGFCEVFDVNPLSDPGGGHA